MNEKPLPHVDTRGDPSGVATAAPAVDGSTPMADWQEIVYGNTPASRAALAFYRTRGWPVDANTFPARDQVEGNIYAFMSGYEAVVAVNAEMLAVLKAFVAAESEWQDEIAGFDDDLRSPFIAAQAIIAKAEGRDA